MSRARKLLAETRRKVEAEGARVLRVDQNGGHYRLVIEHDDGRVQRLSLSCSPTNEHYAPNNVAADVRRFKKGIYT
jgi:hypothetical protein